MKKYTIFVAVSSLLLCSSYTSFLEETNPNKIPASNFYQTEGDIAIVANGVYAALRGNGCYKNMYLYTNVRSESTTLQDPGAGNGVNYQFHNYTLTTDNAQVRTHWVDLCKYVTRANIILDQIDGIPFKDEVVKNKKKAEMYFLRGLIYFHLVMQLGDVPTVIKGLKTKDEIQKYTACQLESKIYSLIISDLTQVINSKLPDIQTGNGVGHASKAAAYALLGKVYLTIAVDSDFQSERTSNLQSAKTNLVAAWSIKLLTSLKDIPHADVFDKKAQTFC